MDRKILVVLACMSVCCLSCIDKSDWPPYYGYQVSLTINNDLDYIIVVEKNFPDSFGREEAIITKEVLRDYEWIKNKDNYWELFADKFSDTTPVTSFSDFVGKLSETVPVPYIKLYRVRNHQAAEEVGCQNLLDCEVTMRTRRESPPPLQSRIPVVYSFFTIQASSIVSLKEEETEPGT